MKKILFLMMLLVISSTSITAQLIYVPVNVTNATLLLPSGRYYYYGDQVMTKKQCIDFLSTRHKPAYEAFQSGYKCVQSSWGLFGAGLGLDLVGSLLLAFVPEEGNDALSISGDICIILGCLGVIASVPTYFIGNARMDKGIDMFNTTQAASAPQAYWTIQGSQNGLGLALHF